MTVESFIGRSGAKYIRNPFGAKNYVFSKNDPGNDRRYEYVSEDEAMSDFEYGPVNEWVYTVIIKTGRGDRVKEFICDHEGSLIEPFQGATTFVAMYSALKTRYKDRVSYRLHVRDKKQE